MSLFDRLLSRGPKLPDPVYDPFGGDLATRRVVEGLKRGDWKEADELLARTRKGDDRAAKAGHIAAAASGWPAWIDEWHKARNDRPEPWLIRGAIQDRLGVGGSRLRSRGRSRRRGMAGFLRETPGGRLL